MEGGLTEYRRYVDRLPVADSPEVFGMHVNADVVSKVRMRGGWVGELAGVRGGERQRVRTLSYVTQC